MAPKGKLFYRFSIFYLNKASAFLFLLSAYSFPFLGVYAPVFPVMKSGSAECFDSEPASPITVKG